jgi:hypothetical protein
MFYRLNLKEGARLLNLHHVREIMLEKTTLKFYYAGNGTGGALSYVPSPVTHVNYDTQAAAKKEFEEVHKAIAASPIRLA